MVSVLIPVHNYDVSGLIDVIYTQAEKEKISYEIIVLDDASNNLAFKKKNQTKIENTSHCFLIEFSKNKGRTFARNTLAQKAKYDYLLFLDADVLPKENNFIRQFLPYVNKYDLVFGGIDYTKNPPSEKQILRWKYGREREAKNVEERNKYHYLSVISMSLFIKKEVFLQVNNFYKNEYGLDVLFCKNLEEIKANIIHIDNPIIHYGLENSVSFLKKSAQAMNTIHQLGKMKKIPEDYRPIQKINLMLNKLKLTLIFRFIFKIFRKLILKNLKSKHPSLFLFDIYRLYHFNNRISNG
ncbi:glycosyltransferase family 2 protein [Mesonia aestuariivivens]|uniref:Glycosyltransferase n=1 Tax=Mesonia aestuariivivens TaxID=2796128 RepID=A0ABS6VZ38_9FLAO|nr:glycosyltransferase [Mesonia aestuariivivens]MBW2960858.1 glycosyltransferase [Mesonia aestuariivivens]